MPGDELYPFDWAELVPHFVHPIKVAIVEAMRWIEEPLSAVQVSWIIDDQNPKLSLVSYHVNSLAEMGAIVEVGNRQVRGAHQTFYFFPEKS